MNAKDRDELLIRLDERSCNTWAVVEKLQTHAEENGKDIRGLKVWRKVIVGVGGTIIAWLVKGEF